MKRLLIAITAFALLTLALFSLWPRGGGPTPGGTVVDVIARLLDKPDTAALRQLERERVAFDSSTRATARAVQLMQAAYRDSLTAAKAKQAAAVSRTTQQQLRVYALEAALARIRDDDDSLPQLVALVAAKDSVITAVMTERDAAMGRVVVLERAVEARDSALVLYRTALNEAMRQRDSYRKFTGRRSLLRAGAVLVATVAVCRALPDPC